MEFRHTTRDQQQGCIGICNDYCACLLRMGHEGIHECACGFCWPANALRDRARQVIRRIPFLMIFVVLFYGGMISLFAIFMVQQIIAFFAGGSGCPDEVALEWGFCDP